MILCSHAARLRCMAALHSQVGELWHHDEWQERSLTTDQTAAMNFA